MTKSVIGTYTAYAVNCSENLIDKEFFLGKYRDELNLLYKLWLPACFLMSKDASFSSVIPVRIYTKTWDLTINMDGEFIFEDKQVKEDFAKKVVEV